MTTFRYGIIGKNWGSKIFRILYSMGKKVVYLNINSPKNYKNVNKYKNDASKIIKNSCKSFDIIWIAVPHYEKFFLVNECVKNNLNVIVEKPWLNTLNKTKKIISLQNRKKLQVGVHFEFLYLKNLLNSQIKSFNKKEFFFTGIFNVMKNKYPKISPYYELGSHLMAIKLFYLNKTQIKKIECSYKKKTLRKIEIKGKKNISINFTNSKEKIIQKYVLDYESKLKNKNSYNIDLKFACNVYKEIKYLLDKKYV